ncbi:hypothetical protein M9H77_21600 [Catharanthus roseus]|uniref:Uncharacterized protein n=1 Tax=Catharanthus roseus TaxID=4058 RepID=A0ACC0AMS7_CATRO|nr:hypothetical protein M9H77_21600 [Catharanthus roseus]
MDDLVLLKETHQRRMLVVRGWAHAATLCNDVFDDQRTAPTIQSTPQTQPNPTHNGRVRPTRHGRVPSSKSFTDRSLPAMPCTSEWSKPQIFSFLASPIYINEIALQHYDHFYQNFVTLTYIYATFEPIYMMV